MLQTLLFFCVFFCSDGRAANEGFEKYSTREDVATGITILERMLEEYPPEDNHYIFWGRSTALLAHLARHLFPSEAQYAFDILPVYKWHAFVGSDQQMRAVLSCFRHPKKNVLVVRVLNGGGVLRRLLYRVKSMPEGFKMLPGTSFLGIGGYNEERMAELLELEREREGFTVDHWGYDNLFLAERGNYLRWGHPSNHLPIKPLEVKEWVDRLMKSPNAPIWEANDTETFDMYLEGLLRTIPTLDQSKTKVDRAFRLSCAMRVNHLSVPKGAGG